MLTDKQLQEEANYGYDKSGNLIKDKSEGIKEIKWTSTGKVKEIIRDEYEKTAQPDLEFHYDCFGRRISKTVKPRHTLDNNLCVLSPISEWVTSYYVHDAQGNEMATYDIHGQENNVGALHLKEQYIYGSSRIGAVDNDKEINSACDLGLNTYGTATIRRNNVGNNSIFKPITIQIGGISIINPTKIYTSLDDLETAINSYVSSVDYVAYKDPTDPINKLIIRATVNGGVGANGANRTISVTGNISVDKNFEEGNFVTCIQQNVRGMKRYEITNYLGNVHAVLTDRKSPVQDLNNPSRVAFYQAEVVSYSDYYPFGMTMVGRSRSANSEGSEFGFNGKRKDNEISGEGNSYDFGARLYNPRLGRWNSIDALASKYPGMSPYNFVANNPIIFVDPDGKDIIIVTSNGTFRAAKRTLLRTPEGKELWNKYANSKNVDVYIAVSKTMKGNSVGETLFDVANTAMVVNDKISVPKSSGYVGFNLLDGLDVSASKGKKIALIVFDANSKDGYFSDNDAAQKEHAKSSGSELYNDYDNAEGIFHELKSHVDLDGSTDEHKAYGSEHNGVMRDDFKAIPGTPASKMRTSLQKLWNIDTKDIKFKPKTHEEMRKEEESKTSPQPAG